MLGMYLYFYFTSKSYYLEGAEQGEDSSVQQINKATIEMANANVPPPTADMQDASVKRPLGEELDGTNIETANAYMPGLPTHSRQASVAPSRSETLNDVALEEENDAEVLEPGVFIRQKMQMADEIVEHGN